MTTETEIKEYFVEKFGKHSFNLWMRQGPVYYGIGTLFFNGPMIKNEWTVNSIETCLSCTERELFKDLEGELVQIPVEAGDTLVAMKDKPLCDVLDYVDTLRIF